MRERPAGSRSLRRPEPIKEKSLIDLSSAEEPDVDEVRSFAADEASRELDSDADPKASSNDEIETESEMDQEVSKPREHVRTWKDTEKVRTRGRVFGFAC